VKGISINFFDLQTPYRDGINAGASGYLVWDAQLDKTQFNAATFSDCPTT
jgi:hypothetical protein